MVAWPRGEAAACKAVHTGSNPVATSDKVTPQVVTVTTIEKKLERLAQR
jgi:hypothetical protein